MDDRWQLLPLGALTRLVQRRCRVEKGVDYPLLGVRWYGGGPFMREVVPGRDAKPREYYRVEAGDFIYNRLFAWKGSFGIVPPNLHGAYVSNEFPTYRIDERVALAEYINLCMGQPRVWRIIEGQSTGSTATSRNRWNPSLFADFEVAVPPLRDQRRIVDFVQALDAASSAAAATARALRIVHGTLREQLLSDAQEEVPLDHLISDIQAGRSPDGSDRQPAVGEASVLKVSAVRQGWFDRTQVKVVTDTGVFPDYALVRNGDLLITRANTQELVGAVCLVDSPYPSCYLCDKTLRLIPNEMTASREYLLEVLQSVASRRQLADAATGTSASMKNISQASILKVRVPLLPWSQQERLARVASGLRDARLQADRLVASLAAVRAAIVVALLAGDVEIPESYDRLLDGAA